MRFRTPRCGSHWRLSAGTCALHDLANLLGGKGGGATVLQNGSAKPMQMCFPDRCWQSPLGRRFRHWSKSTPVGFEPTRGDPIGLAGRRLNCSAKVSLIPRTSGPPKLPIFLFLTGAGFYLTLLPACANAWEATCPRFTLCAKHRSCTL